MTDKAGPQSVRWALFSLKGRIRRATYGLGMALIFTLWWFAVSQLVSFREDSSQFNPLGAHPRCAGNRLHLLHLCAMP